MLPYSNATLAATAGQWEAGGRQSDRHGAGRQRGCRLASSFFSRVPNLKARRDVGTGISNAGMRFFGLVAKFILSVYLAKFTSLADLGLYGLVLSGSMIATAGFGMRIDYPLMRDLPAASRRKASLETNAAAYWLIFNYLFCAIPAIMCIEMFGYTNGLLLSVAIYLLCCMESWANFLYNITVLLNRPQLANNLFFVRSGAWVVPAVLIGLLVPAARTAPFVLLCWLTGVSLGAAINVWAIRDRIDWRWPRLATAGFEFRWIPSALYRSCGIWIGTLALTGGSCADRFILAHYLTLSDVGVATFYLSFTASLATLVQSATFMPIQARLIEVYDRGDFRQYRDIVLRTLRSSVLGAIGLAIPLAVIVRLAGTYAGKAELNATAHVFWLILLAAVIRSVVEGLYYPLFIVRRDREVWTGNLLFCLTNLIGNILLVAKFGLIGIGYSALLAVTVLTIVRAIPLQRSLRSGGLSI
jgi:O-antigen/teichoic acid export membrane protein